MLPEDLLLRIRAYQESRLLLTAIELDVFTAIGQGATAGEVALRLGTDPRATEMLLNALASIEMVRKDGGVFHNSPVAAGHLAEGAPDDARLAMMHTVHQWDRWSTLTDCVRAGAALAREEIGERGDRWLRAFLGAMDYNARARAPLVVDAVQARRVRRMLDVGGGSAAYSIAFARANPNLEADVFDLPAVVPIAQEHIRAAGLDQRARTRAGNLLEDGFGSGYDLVFISAICHMLAPEENVAMFRKAHSALVPGGRVVVQDFILESDKTSPRPAAMFSLNMLVSTRNGASYSEDEYTGWLSEAGFSGICRLHLPGPTGLLAAFRERL